MSAYTLHDFMEFPNFGLKLTLLAPFAWLKDAAKKDIIFEHRLHAIWCLFATANCIYQNFGLLIHYFVVRPGAADAAEANRIAEISQLLSILGYLIISQCKFGILFKHRARITALLEELLLMFPSAQHQQLVAAAAPGPAVRYRTQHFATASRRLMKRTAVIFLLLLFYYDLLPVAQLLYELAAPELCPTYEYHSDTWYPWQSLAAQRHSPADFVVGCVCQITSMLAAMSYVMAGEYLFCFFITQMRMHFDYVARALAALDARSPDASAQLKRLIQYHSRLLRISNEINEIFNPAFMINLTTSSIAICLTSLTIVSMSLMQALQYFAGLSMFVIINFFFCYNAHMFTKASDELRPAVFYGNWYEGDLAYRRMVLFFLMRTRRPQVLRVYNYTSVSMETYMMILKLSYQLFTFFRAID